MSLDDAYIRLSLLWEVRDWASGSALAALLGE